MRARVVAVLFVLVATACGSSGRAEPEPVAFDGVRLLGDEVERDESPDATGAEVKATAEASTAFALDVYRAVAAARPDDNLILSPYSLYRLLAMIDAGAAGTTEEEIRTVLHTDLPPKRLAEALNRLAQELSSRQNNDVTFRSVDAAWVAPELEIGRPFVEVLAREFGAPLAQLDFTDAKGATARVNEWADRSTDGLVPKAVPDGRITPNTKLVLADAVYLDAAWEDPFDPKGTRPGSFTTARGDGVKVRMMRDDGSAPSEYNAEYQAVRLPYAGEDLSMIAVQPHTLPLREFVSSLTPERLGEIVGAIEEGGIHLSFPKFEARSQLALDDALSALGMHTAFSAGADFSGMAAGLFLDFVEQSAYVEVDEKGTKAAAVSTGGFAMSHGPTLEFDRPFLYLVRDDATGTILFIGQVTDPAAAQ